MATVPLSVTACTHLPVRPRTFYSSMLHPRLEARPEKPGCLPLS